MPVTLTVGNRSMVVSPLAMYDRTMDYCADRLSALVRSPFASKVGGSINEICDPASHWAVRTFKAAYLPFKISEIISEESGYPLTSQFLLSTFSAIAWQRFKHDPAAGKKFIDQVKPVLAQKCMEFGITGGLAYLYAVCEDYNKLEVFKDVYHQLAMRFPHLADIVECKIAPGYIDQTFVGLAGEAVYSRCIEKVSEAAVRTIYK